MQTRLFVLVLALSLTLGTPSLYANNLFVERKEVQAFIQKMVKHHHFDKHQLTLLFKDVKMRPQVVRHVFKPLEKEPWHIYQMAFVTERHIKQGIQFWKKHAATLQRAEKTYGIPASIIVATMGIETKYGERTGAYRVLDSLCNLGFSHSPRAPYFRKELEEFLLLTREEHLDARKIMGSYAGAIGQPQFMPSSYRHYAVNFSKSGKIDLMHNITDIIGSIANYYQKHGWSKDQPIAVQAAKRCGCHYQACHEAMSIHEIIKRGLVPKNKVAQDDAKAKVIELDNRSKKEYWLGFHNFAVIKRYNCSDLYAMAVYQLSDYISLGRKKVKND